MECMYFGSCYGFVSLMLASWLSDPRNCATSLMLGSFACLGLFTRLVVPVAFNFLVIPSTLP